MIAVWKRELREFFTTPSGYVFMGLFLLINGYFFWACNLAAESSDMSAFFNRVVYSLMFFTPILTMKLLSEEKRSKVDQLLLTAPLSTNRIVIGKYLSAVTVFLISTLLTSLYPVVVAVFGKLTLATVLVQYAGVILLGMTYIAVGTLVSCVCESQVTSVIIALVANILLQVLENLPSMISDSSAFSFLSSVFSWLSFTKRFSDFSIGLLGVGNIVYFISIVTVLLVITGQLLDRRRWREN